MSDQHFEPSRYLTKVSGSDYLEVKYRLVWLNDTGLPFTIDTDIIELSDQRCVCKARITITNESGVSSAEGIGSETPQDFRDYIEKAHTKALGRALAMLGYGTQFADADGFYAEGVAGRPVDAPVPRPQAGGQATTHTPTQGNGQRPIAPGPRVPGGASEKQVWLITKLAREKGLDEVMFHAKLADWAQVGALEDLTSGKASAVIDKLQNYQPESIDNVPF